MQIDGFNVRTARRAHQYTDDSWLGIRDAKYGSVEMFPSIFVIQIIHDISVTDDSYYEVSWMLESLHNIIINLSSGSIPT